MSNEKNKTARVLEEVSHFFLSPPSPDIKKIGHAAVSSGRGSYALASPEKLEGIIPHNPLGPLVRDLASSPRAFRDRMGKSTEGVIVLDRDKKVRLINSVAGDLLSIQNEEFRGQLFHYFIEVNQSTQIGIFQKNRKTGIGEMRMIHAEWEGEAVFLVTIRDITSSLQTPEGAIRFPC